MLEMASLHKEILHGQPIVEGSDIMRSSFYDANGEMEVIQEHAGEKVYYPYMILHKPMPRYEFHGDVYRRVVLGFEIRVLMDEGDEVKPAAIADARDKCQRIAEEVAAYINLKAEEELQESPFFGFDVESMQGDFTKPQLISEIGYALRWSNMQMAWDQFHFNPADFFNIEGGEPTEPQPDDEWQEVGW